MAKTIAQLITEVVESGDFRAALNNARVQFGTRSRRRLGAELLPERTVLHNQYEETNVRYRTIVANDGSRYSPAQKVGDAIVGSFDVKLLESDLAIEITAEEYEAINSLLAAGRDVEAATRVMKAADRLAQGLVDKDEVRRWEAIVDAKIVRVGDNGFREEVNLSDPEDHRIEAALAWEDADADPFLDIGERVQLLADKGYEVSRIICSRRLVARMARSPKVRERAGTARVTLELINSFLAEDGLPGLELYDAVYHTKAGSKRFIPENVMIFVALTGRDEEVTIADDEVETIENVLGYTGIGTATGQGTPGRAFHTASYTNRPPRVELEGWQTSGPVILDPEAIAVLTVPAAA